MATRLTKNTLPIADYQVWTSANSNEGDILDVYNSLGGRPADTITIESESGNSLVKFNVSHEIYAEHANSVVSGVFHNPFVGLGLGAVRSSPHLIKEIEVTKAGITITNGSTQTWTKGEVTVNDIKIITASGLRITVT